MLVDRFRIVSNASELEETAVCLQQFGQYFSGLVFDFSNSTDEYFTEDTTYQIRHVSSMVDSEFAFFFSFLLKKIIFNFKCFEAIIQSHYLMIFCVSVEVELFLMNFLIFSDQRCDGRISEHLRPKHAISRSQIHHLRVLFSARLDAFCRR